MSSRNPASILFDAYGNEVAILEGYGLVSTSPGLPIIVRDLNGNALFLNADTDGYLYVTAPNLEGKDFATQATLLDAYNRLVEIEGKDFATQVTLLDAYNRLVGLEAKDFATETTLAALELKAATEATLLDSYNRLVGIEGTDFATQTTLLDAYNKLTILEAKDFATETTLAALELKVATESTLLDAYNRLVTIEGKDFATQDTLLDAYNKLVELENKDFATETTQQTLATEVTQQTLSTEDTLVDAYNKLDSLEAKDFATETSLLDAYNKLTSLEAKDFATETTLSSIKDTDGIKKITDALPIGDNEIGRVKFIDAYGAQVPILDGYSLEATAPGIPVMGIAPDSTATFLNASNDGYLQTKAEITEPLPAGTNILGEVGLDLPQLEDQLPEPDSFDLGTRGSPHIDYKRRLITKSQISSDEGAFRDDFTSTLEATLTGTLTFTAGKVVTGSGTAFTTELTRDHFIRLSSDDGYVAERVDQIYSDTSLLLKEDYEGTAAAGAATCSYWRINQAAGMTIVQSGTVLTISTGTTSGEMSHFLRNFKGPGDITALLAVSQRIANTELLFGVHGNLGLSQSEAYFVFDGVLAKKIKLRTKSPGGTIKESTFTLPAGESTSDQHEYKVEIQHERVRFHVDGLLAGEHGFHIMLPYEHLWAGAHATNTGTPASSTDLVVDDMFIAEKTVIEVKVSGALDNLRVDDSGNLQINIAAASQALPLIVNSNYERSNGAIVAGQYKRVIEYVIPADYNGWLIRYSSFQNEASKSRLVSFKEMGTYEFVTEVFTADEVYILPQWTSLIEAEVTTQTDSAGATTVVITVGYTNQDGTTGRTGTFTVPKSSIVGTRIPLILQTGDIGVVSIQSMSDDGTGVGAVKLFGNIQLAYHNDLSNTTQLETNYQPGAIAFPTATALAVEYAGGTVSKDRLFDMLIQLVAIVT